MRYILIVAWFLLMLAPAQARDDEHLVPESSIFSEYIYSSRGNYSLDEYYYDVLRVLNVAFEHETFARVIVLPSFSNEYAIALSRKNGKYEVLYAISDLNLWSVNMVKSSEEYSTLSLSNGWTKDIVEKYREKLPLHVADIDAKVCRKELPPSLGDRLHALWADMLFRTRYRDQRPILPGDHVRPRLGLDGTTFHFSFGNGSAKLAGETWSPKPDSNTGRFVEIAEQLKISCLEDKEEHFDQLERMVEKLQSVLAKSEY